ncbi:hypothetical protein GLW03_04640 [Halobacillus halophilus]|uniref:hypothetical protein n=1 Tax=Halobacillus halophilus TaxID=1570 RepID=UPI001369152F|nr:hypothetical protein [Halobacillus halophilus]MYL29098.1 hypothetical protein [Halobacillus halophilus]
MDSYLNKYHNIALLIIISISFSFFIMAYFSNFISVSNIVLMSCSVFVALFSLGDLTLDYYNESKNKFFGFISVVSFLFAIPLALFLGFFTVMLEIPDNAISRLTDSVTFIAIGILFFSYATGLIPRGSSKQRD